MSVHPTAVVAPGAALDADVEIGAYSIIGPQVRIGSGTIVGPHVVIDGLTTIGRRNHIFQYAAIGAVPQDLKYKGEPSRLVIGDGNRIREFATLHPGTEGGGMVTTVGNGNLLMNYCHIAHDCRLQDSIIVANGVQLGGHVTIESFAVLGALSAVHQFARVGESAIVGAGSMVSQDVPPFCNATGDRARLHGLNTLGLQRRGLAPETIAALKSAYRVMFQSRLKARDAIAQLRAQPPLVPEVERFVAFIEASERGVCR